MPITVAAAGAGAPHVNPDRDRRVRDRRMATATLYRTPEAARAAIGGAIDQARLMRGWTLDQLARHLAPPAGATLRDPRQVQRWISGADRAQLDVLFACTDDLFVAHLYELLAPLSRRYFPTIHLQRTA